MGYTWDDFEIEVRQDGEGNYYADVVDPQHGDWRFTTDLHATYDEARTAAIREIQDEWLDDDGDNEALYVKTWGW